MRTGSMKPVAADDLRPLGAAGESERRPWGAFVVLDDGPAAPRYTEARMAAAALTLTNHLDEDVVDFVPNYDNQLTAASNQASTEDTQRLKALLGGNHGQGFLAAK